MRMILGIILVACIGTVHAADKKPALMGSWLKNADGFELKFTFEKDDKFTFSMSNGTDGATIKSKYKLGKDDMVKSEVQEFEKMGNFPKDVEKGYQFKFKIKIKGDKAIISDIEGKEIDDAAKSIIEGTYDKK